MSKLIKAYEDYIKLLVDEIDELCVIATSHGWVTTRYEKGIELRNKIINLKKEGE